jgi:hypothetical protein
MGTIALCYHQGGGQREQPGAGHRSGATTEELSGPELEALLGKGHLAVKLGPQKAPRPPAAGKTKARCGACRARCQGRPPLRPL